MDRLLARVIGSITLLFGVAGFLPWVTTDGVMFGTFTTNVWHNLLLLFSGIYGLAAGFSRTVSPKTYFQTLTMVFGVVGVTGLVLPSPLLGLIEVDRAGSATHLLLAALGLYFGFIHAPEPPPHD
ncbi:MAG: DUF4383 domain-containing protein [bacterium]|nr:DUF4383 domain-containing protein [bacterium]